MQTSRASSHENIFPTLNTPLLQDEKAEGELVNYIELREFDTSLNNDDEIISARFLVHEQAHQFLVALGIPSDDSWLNPEILEEILKIEFNPYRSILRWATFDSALERLLQTSVTARSALNPINEKEKCNHSRIWLHGRSLPLYHQFNLKSTLLIRNFLRGVELTTFKAIHYFFYGLLGYHLYQLISAGRDDFSDISGALTNVKENGLVNLVQALARLPTEQLKMLLGLLPVPTVILMANGLMRPSLWSEAKVNEMLLNARPQQIVHFVYTELWQWVPFLPVSRRIQSLEWALRWQAPLSHEDKWRIVYHLEDLALNSHKYIQRSAMQSLARILHSFHGKDLMILVKSGSTAEVLQDYLAIKQTCLKTLQQLSKFNINSEGFGQILQYMNQSIKVIYANYLLWWAGYSPNKKASVIFPTLKSIKLALEITLLVNLIKVIQEALDCPKQPGFVFGEGFAQEWSGNFTPECFSARLRLFRTLNSNESLNQLIDELLNYHLAGLTELDLSGKRLSSEEAAKLVNAIIQRGAQLTVLDLSSNILHSLPLELFINLGQLQSLNLSDNQISAISSDVFAPLTQLESLDLRLNQLETIPSNAFIHLSQLQKLYLNSNQITAVPSYAFTSLFQLQLLDLVSNQIVSISTDAFSGLSQLQTLDLSLNQLMEISPNVFRPLVQLKYLNLAFNQLSVISDNIFFSLSQLETLDLSFNQINAISSSDFSDLPQLQKLDLSFNQLTIISADVFQSLSQLKTLNLGNNQLANITCEIWAHLFQLQSLDLSSNQIANISVDTFVPLSKLQSLGLGDNQLAVISAEIFKPLYQLQSLDLGFNRFTTLSASSFINLTQLETLDLSHNQFTSIPIDFFTHLSQLQKLDLSHNQFTDVPTDAFKPLSQLKTLDLFSNQLKEISANAFWPLSQLQSLDLVGNQLTAIATNAFAYLYQLQSLDLSFNQIIIISNDTFMPLTQLQSLDLSFNQLVFIPKDAFSSLYQLRNLRLSNNHLKSLMPYTFSSLSQLQELFIDNNYFSEIPAKSFINLPQLRYLTLSHNNISHIDKDAFFQVNFLQGALVLSRQHLDDVAIYNLSLSLPNGITGLDLRSNNIGQQGVKVLASVLPCSSITDILLAGNPVNTSTLNLQAQANALRNLCEAQRCQDIWPTGACEINKPEILSSTQVEQKDRDIEKLGATSLFKKPRAWFQDLMNKTLETACHVLGSYAQQVVSSCPAYFDPQAGDKIARKQPLQSRWSDSPYALFSSKKIKQSSHKHLTLSNTTQVNFHRR